LDKSSPHLRKASAPGRVRSIFSQLLQLFSRIEFEQAVKRHRAEFDESGQATNIVFCIAMDLLRSGRRLRRNAPSAEWRDDLPRCFSLRLLPGGHRIRFTKSGCEPLFGCGRLFV